MTKTDAGLTWLPNKTFELEFSLPWAEVKKTFDIVIKQLAEKADIKGFRKGKAPRELVETRLDKGRIYGEVINLLLPQTYAAAVKKHQLKPALAPKITIVSAEENKDWRFKAKACELPEVKPGNWEGTARSALVKSQLEKKELTQSQKFDLIARALINAIPLELPEILVETERDRLLSRLLSELQRLGLTLDQYAANNQKTVEQIRREYAQTAANSLKLELILQTIAAEKKFSVADKDIDAMIAQAGDDKLSQRLNTPSERAYIATVLKKKQAIDFLTALG